MTPIHLHPLLQEVMSSAWLVSFRLASVCLGFHLAFDAMDTQNLIVCLSFSLALRVAFCLQYFDPHYLLQLLQHVVDIVTHVCGTYANI